MLINDATVADLEAVHALDRDVFGDDSYDRIALRQFFDLFPNFMLLAREREEVVGYALGGLSSSAGESWFLALGVRSSIRGRGVGRQLSRLLVSRLFAAGAESVQLTVSARNKSAVNLYHQIGFREVSQIPDYYGDNQARSVLKLIEASFEEQSDASN